MLFVMLHKVVLTFESVGEILKCDHSIGSYCEHYFPVVLFLMLHKVILTFESVGEILKCDHSIGSYREQYSLVVLIIVLLCKAILTFDSKFQVY